MISRCIMSTNIIWLGNPQIKHRNRADNICARDKFKLRYWKRFEIPYNGLHENQKYLQSCNGLSESIGFISVNNVLSDFFNVELKSL